LRAMRRGASDAVDTRGGCMLRVPTTARKIAAVGSEKQSLVRGISVTPVTAKKKRIDES
jgi:hypothetical protein